MILKNKQTLSVSCVIPAHNEAANIKKLIYHLKPILEKSSLVEWYELVIVDDNSTDSTGQIIDSLALNDTHIKVIHRINTPGFGNAVRAGLAVASGEVIIPVMADLSDDPKDIIKLVEKIRDGYDVVYGSRFIEGGYLHDYPFLKLIANRVFNNLIRFMFGIPQKDITNAFKAYHYKVLEEIGIEGLKSSGFDLTAELPLRAHIAGFSSVEVPVSWFNRTAGEAHLKLSQNATVYGLRLLKMFIYGGIIALRDLLGSIVTGSRIGFLFSLLFGLIIVFLFCFISGISSILHHFALVSPSFVALAAGSVIFAFLFRLWRWRVIYRASGYVIPRTSLFRVMMFGWLLNYLLPGRIGDIARAFVLKGTDDVPAGLSLATIIVERIFDLFTLFLILGVGGIIVGHKIWLLQTIIVLFITLMILGLFILLRSESFFIRLLQGRIQILIRSIHAIKSGMSLMSQNYWAMSLSLLLSLLVWLFEACTLYFSTKALHFDLSFIETTLAGIGGYLVSSLPVTPGAAGLYEVSVSGGFSIFGIDLADGVSIAILDHVIRTIIILSIGTLCMIQIGFQIRCYLRKNSWLK